MYIPDLAERYPEGLDGADLTANYYPAEKTAADDFIEAELMADEKETEPENPEQQLVTYHNGYALENKNRKQAREPFTREELEKIYDQKIENSARRWGATDYYTKQAREIKAKNLSDWDEGKVVQAYSEEYTEDCINFADTYYSDGTKITSCYGYDD